MIREWEEKGGEEGEQMGGEGKRRGRGDGRRTVGGRGKDGAAQRDEMQPATDIRVGYESVYSFV
jgi:hypothetical protein